MRGSGIQALGVARAVALCSMYVCKMSYREVEQELELAVR